LHCECDFNLVIILIAQCDFSLVSTAADKFILSKVAQENSIPQTYDGD